LSPFNTFPTTKIASSFFTSINLLFTFSIGVTSSLDYCKSELILRSIPRDENIPTLLLMDWHKLQPLKPDNQRGENILVPLVPKLSKFETCI